MGVEVHSLRFETNLGPVIAKIWDCAGADFFCLFNALSSSQARRSSAVFVTVISARHNLRTPLSCLQYLSICAQAAIFMFDVTSRMTYKNLPNWYIVQRVGGGHTKVRLHVL